jgi:hypothetical protein
MTVKAVNPGVPLVINGKYYHSRYDPAKEAERFFSSLSIKPNSIYVLIAPGHDHLAAHIRNTIPGSPVFSVQPACFQGLVVPADDTATWFESSTVSLYDQLSMWLSDEDTARLEMIVWPTAWKIFPEFCHSCASIIAAYLREADANLKTSAYFGFKWIKNMVGNVRNLPHIRAFPNTKGIAILAGSGPGLNHCLEVLVENRNKYVLWALPSSLRALESRGLVPDIIVSSDAGYWAGEHLRYVPYSSTTALPIVVAPLRAMLSPLWKKKYPVALFSMGLPLESELLDIRFGMAGMAHQLPIFGDRGTVAATALDILRITHKGPVYSMGLDFAWVDVQAHVSPHTFDEQKVINSSRICQEETLRYWERERNVSSRLASGWIHMAPLTIYQNWMLQHAYARLLNIRDYNPSQVDKGLPLISVSEIGLILSRSKKISADNVIPGSELPNSIDFMNGIRAYLLKLRVEARQNRIFDERHAELLRLICPFAWRDFRKGSISENELAGATVRVLDELIDLRSVP